MRIHLSDGFAMTNVSEGQSSRGFQGKEEDRGLRVLSTGSKDRRGKHFTSNLIICLSHITVTKKELTTTSLQNLRQIRLIADSHGGSCWLAFLALSDRSWFISGEEITIYLCFILNIWSSMWFFWPLLTKYLFLGSWVLLKLRFACISREYGSILISAALLLRY